MSLSIVSHKCSSSTQVVVVLRIVSKRFKEICVLSDSPGSILGCLVTGIVIEEQNNKKISILFRCYLDFGHIKESL
jgi:hypothetical protein